MYARADQMVAAMRELLDAHEAGRSEMDRADGLLRFGIDHLEAGGDFTSTVDALPSVSQRQDMNDAFKRIIDARHELRLQILGVCLDQEMKPREIGERWGVSRQRVAKYMVELKERRAAEDEVDVVVEPYVHVSTIRLPG